MLNEPYLASAVARLPVIAVEDSEHVPTMATDGYHIYVNPKFCETLTKQKQSSFSTRSDALSLDILNEGERDHKIWNQAIDHNYLFLLQMNSLY